MPSTKLENNKYQFYKLLVWLDQVQNFRSLDCEACTLCIWCVVDSLLEFYVLAAPKVIPGWICTDLWLCALMVAIATSIICISKGPLYTGRRSLGDHWVIKNWLDLSKAKKKLFLWEILVRLLISQTSLLRGRQIWHSLKNHVFL